MIPTRIVKAIAGVLLLPVCWVVSKTCFEEFSRAASGTISGRRTNSTFSPLGALYWTIAFFGLPRPLLIYVFGHELTHALWVWLQGGRVSAFQVGRDGGSIIADRRDFLVSLAPYFFPLYSIAVIAVYAAISWYYPEAWYYRRWLFAALGVDVGVPHLVHGLDDPETPDRSPVARTFFSLVVIYLANLAVLAVLLVVACPQGRGWGSQTVSSTTPPMRSSGFATGPAGIYLCIGSASGRNQTGAENVSSHVKPPRALVCLALLMLAGCGSPLPPIPPAPTAAIHSSPDARALFDACLAAHGGAAAYARLHDVNVRFSSHWASIGPKLQPKLSDTATARAATNGISPCPTAGPWSKPTGDRRRQTRAAGAAGQGYGQLQRQQRSEHRSRGSTPPRR